MWRKERREESPGAAQNRAHACMHAVATRSQATRSHPPGRWNIQEKTMDESARVRYGAVLYGAFGGMEDDEFSHFVPEDGTC